jgi:hypothetical protein
MFDLEAFQNKMDELALRCQVQLPQNPSFDETAINEFSTDIADVINGINPFMGKSFLAFYRNIGCQIMGDQVDTVTIDHASTCENLINFLHQITPPASITIRFYLQNARIPDWNDCFEDVSVYFRHDEFELEYQIPANDPIRFVKEYRNDLLLDVAPPLMAHLAGRFSNVIAAKVAGQAN